MSVVRQLCWQTCGCFTEEPHRPLTAPLALLLSGLQPEELLAFQHFPPRSVVQLQQQRDVLLRYSTENKVGKKALLLPIEALAALWLAQPPLWYLRSCVCQGPPKAPPPALPLQVSVLAGLCLCYVLMQTFAIPGTLTLSLLSGALYGVKRGWLLVAGMPTCWHVLRLHCSAMYDMQCERAGEECSMPMLC